MHYLQVFREEKRLDILWLSEEITVIKQIVTKTMIDRLYFIKNKQEGVKNG